jgi:hypothetical protein
MISPTTPSAAITSTPRFREIAARRWDDWSAATLIWLGQHSLSYNLDACRCLHREWLASLLARGIPLRVIRRLSLDDPRESRLELERRAQEYTDRRLRRSTKEH